ncbi:MAG: BRO family protein [Bilophila wadsworthia]
MRRPRNGDAGSAGHSEHDEQRPIVDIIHTLNDSTGLRRDSRIISEPGLYSLILRSRKPKPRRSSGG